MTQTISFVGNVPVHYAQIVLVSGAGDFVDPLVAFAGQRNELCGAGVSGALFLVTATHTGDVRIEIRVETEQPKLADWDEVVEVSYRPTTPSVTLLGWDGEVFARFELSAPSYRARWSRQGPREQGRELERCRLELWPAGVADEEILRLRPEADTR